MMACDQILNNTLKGFMLGNFNFILPHRTKVWREKSLAKM